MDVLTLTYSRLYNLGNYENEKIEVTVSIDNGDVTAARVAAVAAVEAEHAQMLAERRGSTPKTVPVPASDKQRNYIATLQDQLGWHSEQMAVYAQEQGIDLVSMTTAQASTFIDGLKRLTQVQSGKLPF